ncbi:MAG: helix-turn-helix domain-containing protein, partial [Candidatus Binatia bacterium]
MISISKLWAKLRNRKYRQAFVATQLKRGVPLQIQALRKKLGWTQAKLAERAGLKQGTISRCEDPDYGELTFNTVLAIANGFDVAFVGKFVPFSELANWHDDLLEHPDVLTFKEEDAQALSETEVQAIDSEVVAKLRPATPQGQVEFPSLPVKVEQGKNPWPLQPKRTPRDFYEVPW